MVRGEPKSMLDPGSKSRKCFKREGVTVGYQGAGLRPKQLSFQWSQSARKEPHEEGQFGDKDMSYV